MNERRRSLLRTLAITAVIPAALGLSGCATPAASDSNEAISSALRSSVETAVPDANGAFVGLNYSGPSHRVVLVVLYLKSDDASSVAKAVDAGFATVWKNAPFEPAAISVGAVVADVPAKPTRSNPDSLDPTPIASTLGIPAGKAKQLWIELSDIDLRARYGTWQAPAQ